MTTRRETPPQIAKPLAAVLTSTYDLAMTAREAVEHRLASIPRQEAEVKEWKENLTTIAATRYPGHDVSSYPVQTRMQREFEQLDRYRSELPDRLNNYSKALQKLERTTGEVIEAAKRVSAGNCVPWPKPPKVLLADPWPRDWPQRPLLGKEGPAEMAYEFEAEILPPRRMPSPTTFTLEIAEHSLELNARYEEGVSYFSDELYSSIRGGSRWPAITEAVRCGIYWRQLDSYLAECNQPWLPEFYVGEMFGLRGILECRDQLADFLAQLSPEAGRWYLSTQPIRSRAGSLDSLDYIEELMAVGLVRWGPEMPPAELLGEIPFAEVKLLFMLAGLSPPRGFEAAVARYGELVSAHGQEFLWRRIRSYIDPSEVVEVREIDGWHREERLGPRARANLMVSTLILLSDINSGAQQVIDWNG